MTPRERAEKHLKSRVDSLVLILAEAIAEAEVEARAEERERCAKMFDSREPGLRSSVADRIREG